MQLVLKGEFETLKNHKLVLDVYQMLPLMLKHLEGLTFVDNKKEVTFIGQGTYLKGYRVKVILNNKTDVLTIKIFK